MTAFNIHHRPNLTIAAVRQPNSADALGNHIVCHCTENNITFCMADATTMPFDSDACTSCPACAYFSQDTMLTCPWGCDCRECGSV